jgi:hypothetical protein
MTNPLPHNGSTVNGHRGPARTAAATAAGKRAKAERLASEVGIRVSQLDNDWLLALALVVVSELEYRALPIPHELDDD